MMAARAGVRQARGLSRAVARPGRDEQRPAASFAARSSATSPTGAACSDRLPPSASPRRDERLRDFTKQWLDQLGNLEFDRLSQDGKVDFLLLKNQLAHELRQIDIRGKEMAESASLVPFADAILELDEARRQLQADGLVESRRRPDRPDQADRRSSPRPGARAPRQGPGEEAWSSIGPWPRPKACERPSEAGSASTMVTTRCSPGGWKSRTRPPTRRSTLMRACSGRSIGAVAGAVPATTAAPAAAGGGGGGAGTRRAAAMREDDAGAGRPHRPDRRAPE